MISQPKKYNPNIFFTSDTHFNHSAILQYCDRPFKDIQEMDDVLINNWNSVISKEDHVFHLGDLFFGPTSYCKELLPRLNGKIHLVIGNHDIKNMKNSSLLSEFEEVNYQITIRVKEKLEYQEIIMTHYPLLTYSGCNRGTLNLFGHVHTRVNNTGFDAERLDYLLPTQYDVGVDNNNFKPISYGDVMIIINNQINGIWKRKI